MFRLKGRLKLAYHKKRPQSAREAIDVERPSGENPVSTLVQEATQDTPDDDIITNASPDPCIIAPSINTGVFPKLESVHACYAAGCKLCEVLVLGLEALNTKAQASISISDGPKPVIGVRPDFGESFYEIYTQRTSQ